MELKWVQRLSVVPWCAGSNRTFMELKYRLITASDAERKF